MNTYQTQLDRIWSHFSKVLLLSDKNGCRVWKLRHRTLEKELVLHLLPSAHSVYEPLCHLRCPNLPAVYEVYTFEEGTIVLEEYIEGLTVAEIAATGRYRKRGALKILREVCKALMVLHQEGIIHRDIKPENIMVDRNGRVVLIDFNAARKMTVKKQDTVVMGTVGYASPEQMGIAQSDERTDIYALGVLLNVLLTGQHPSQEIPKGRLGRIIRKCTSIHPKDRFPSVQKLYQTL